MIWSRRRQDILDEMAKEDYMEAMETGREPKSITDDDIDDTDYFHQLSGRKVILNSISETLTDGAVRLLVERMDDEDARFVMDYKDTFHELIPTCEKMDIDDEDVVGIDATTELLICRLNFLTLQSVLGVSFTFEAVLKTDLVAGPHPETSKYDKDTPRQPKLLDHAFIAIKFTLSMPHNFGEAKNYYNHEPTALRTIRRLIAKCDQLLIAISPHFDVQELNDTQLDIFEPEEKLRYYNMYSAKIQAQHDADSCDPNHNQHDSSCPPSKGLQSMLDILEDEILRDGGDFLQQDEAFGYLKEQYLKAIEEEDQYLSHIHDDEKLETTFEFETKIDDYDSQEEEFKAIEDYLEQVALEERALNKDDAEVNDANACPTNNI